MDNRLLCLDIKKIARLTSYITNLPNVIASNKNALGDLGIMWGMEQNTPGGFKHNVGETERKSDLGHSLTYSNS